MIDSIIKLYLVIPLILIIVTVFVYRNAHKKRLDYEECNGIIVGFKKYTGAIHADSDESDAAAPIVAYEVDGVNYEFKGKFRTNKMKPGDNVKVLYKKDNPSQATMKAGAGFATVIMSILSIVSVIPVIIYIIWRM